MYSFGSRGFSTLCHHFSVLKFLDPQLYVFVNDLWDQLRALYYTKATSHWKSRHQSSNSKEAHIVGLLLHAKCMPGSQPWSTKAYYTQTVWNAMPLAIMFEGEVSKSVSTRTYISHGSQARYWCNLVFEQIAVGQEYISLINSVMRGLFGVNLSWERLCRAGVVDGTWKAIRRPLTMADPSLLWHSCLVFTWQFPSHSVYSMPTVSSCLSRAEQPHSCLCYTCMWGSLRLAPINDLNCCSENYTLLQW